MARGELDAAGLIYQRRAGENPLWHGLLPLSVRLGQAGFRRKLSRKSPQLM